MYQKIIDGKKYTIIPSTRKNKKYDVFLDGKYVVSFGDIRYESFPQHKNKERLENYKSRHRNDNINDPNYAGFWSYWILWNKPSIKESIKDTEKKFNIKIHL